MHGRGGRAEGVRENISPNFLTLKGTRRSRCVPSSRPPCQLSLLGSAVRRLVLAPPAAPCPKRGRDPSRGAPLGTVPLGPCCPGAAGSGGCVAGLDAAAMGRGAPLGLRLLRAALLLLLFLCPAAGSTWMWLGIAAAGGPEKQGCTSPPLSRRQLDLCEQKPELVPAIREGARLGLQECRSQFRHERWDCRSPPAARRGTAAPAAPGHQLSSGTKETAFIYAVTSAGLVHSVTRSCSAGNVTECSCDLSLRHGGSASEGWHWGGCSDDIHYGMSFSRKFLDMPLKNLTGKSGSGLVVMNLHNNEAGRQAVAKLMSVDCRCHGVSGSCAVKTCWKTMSSFEKIGRFLKDKYENSIQISDRLKKKLRRKEKSQRKVPIGKEDLLYVNKSPNYCVEDQKLGIPGTQGRECNRTSQGPDGCNLLCCGRGYNTHVVRHVERCECKFVWCCYVRCRRCETMTDVHTCK
ncbi:protein Wnt-16 [Manacus candei]|uniref:protein Wnt-16 n=1 Tax=Manacus candei TaxID=415023 RepID=UPI002226472B|nr:protein Wnt-16 [Manacus candei]